MRSKKLWLPVLALLVAGGMYTLFHGGDNHDANGGDGAHASTTEEYERGIKKSQLGDCFIRGNNVMYIGAERAS